MAKIAVAPLVGAWIEIFWCVNYMRGIKVAPLVGAWIEISRDFCKKSRWKVAPLVGAWIEIEEAKKAGWKSGSLPSWERGLKWSRCIRVQ